MTEAAQGNLHFGLKQLKSEWALMLNSVNITKSIPVDISYTVEALKTPTDWILALKWDENDSPFQWKPGSKHQEVQGLARPGRWGNSGAIPAWLWCHSQGWTFTRDSLGWGCGYGGQQWQRWQQPRSPAVWRWTLQEPEWEWGRKRRKTELFQGRWDGSVPEPQGKNLLNIPGAIRGDFNAIKEKELVVL